MDLRQLAAELEQLARVFERASCDWPNLESQLTTWPHEMPEPDPPPMICGIPIGKTTWMPTAFSPMWRKINETHYGMLSMTRDVGKIGRGSTSVLTGSDIDASERLIVLGKHAVRLLMQLPNPPTLQPTVEFEQWRFFLHGRSTVGWQDLIGYSAEYRRHVIEDIFLESARVLRSLLVEGDNEAAKLDLILADLSPMQRKMIEFLLKEKSLTSRRSKFEMKVWGSKPLAPDTVKKAVSRLNDRLLELKSQYSVSLGGDFVKLHSEEQ